MNKNILKKFLPTAIITLLVCVVAGAQNIFVKTTFRVGDFPLARQNKTATIYFSAADAKVVRIAANDLAADIKRVTGLEPNIEDERHAPSGNAVIIGTLGKNHLIDRMVQNRKIDVASIRGKWESYLIATVKNPLPSVPQALVIIGSDRRGTAYGVYELSQMIGVSPWVWWADVTPEHKSSLIISPGITRGGEPSVKYRGIFINDEDWGLQPWAAKTFEPETGDIGPKTYAKIFELLLRLKANTVWPAMHEVTRPFNSIPGNAQTADDYAIVMGSSHAEPMLRNNVGEWKDEKDRYDFKKNPDGVKKYWEDRVAANGKFENIYTLGMRGIHDSPIQGVKNQPERIALLEEIFSFQRSLLSKYVDPNAEKVPQIFCPYKEVLADYRAGLKVPGDVTIVFPDDNFGYIRQFPNAEEQKRKGGFGVYYHISYLGRPLSYLWLNTTPPALIWEEMSKAYDHNMRKLWVVNAGDIKPGEIGAEFFFQMAWDIKRWRRENLSQFLETWAKREFGEKHSAQIAGIMKQYYALNFQRKPEHLQWYLPNEKPVSSDLTPIDYGDEIQRRFNAFDELEAKAAKIAGDLPAAKKDAFYELVSYPIKSAAAMNDRYLGVEKTALFAAQGRDNRFAANVRTPMAELMLKAETESFFNKIAGGKWRGIMSPQMGPGQWPSMRSTPPPIPSAAPDGPAKPVSLDLVVEGSKDIATGDAALPVFSVFTKERHFFDCYANHAKRDVDSWFVKAKQDWIKVDSNFDEPGDWENFRLWVSIDWAKAPRGENVTGEIDLFLNGERQDKNVIVKVFNPVFPRPENLKGFVESNGVISIEAENFSRKSDYRGISWQIIPGLGRRGDSIALFPTNSILDDKSSFFPAVEYDIYSFSEGEFEISCYLIPTHPLEPGKGLRYRVAIDREAPQLITVDAGMEVGSRKWSQNVLNASTVGTSKIKLTKGRHVLKIYGIDAGVVIDNIVINTGGLRKSYLGPPETMIEK